MFNGKFCRQASSFMTNFDILLPKNLQKKIIVDFGHKKDFLMSFKEFLIKRQ